MAAIRLQGITTLGSNPASPCVRLVGIVALGQTSIASDVFVYEGANWLRTHIVSWSGTNWR